MGDIWCPPKFHAHQSNTALEVGTEFGHHCLNTFVRRDSRRAGWCETYQPLFFLFSNPAQNVEVVTIFTSAFSWQVPLAILVKSPKGTIILPDRGIFYLIPPAQGSSITTVIFWSFFNHFKFIFESFGGHYWSFLDQMSIIFCHKKFSPDLNFPLFNIWVICWSFLGHLLLLKIKCLSKVWKLLGFPNISTHLTLCIF
jgi:hypothetical protein